MKWVRQFEGPFLVVSTPTSLTAKIQRSQKAQIRVVHIDKLKHFNGSPPKAWKLPVETAGSGENLHCAIAGPNSAGQGSIESPPEVAIDSNTDPNVVDGHVQFNTEEGRRPESVTISSQSAMKDAITNAGNDSTPFGRKGRRPRGHRSSVQPMGLGERDRGDSCEFSAPMGARKSVGDSSSPRGVIRSHGKDAQFSASMDARKLEGDLLSSGCATGSHSSGAKFSAPKGARKFEGDFPSPRGAQKSQGKVRVAGGQHGKGGETSRFATGEVPHECGAVTPSDKADCLCMETRLDSLSESAAHASEVASGRLDDEQLSHEGCAASPSVMADPDVDCSVTDRIVDLHGDSDCGSNVSVDCGRARGTAECCATTGNTPGVVEPRSDTTDGVACNWEICEGLSPSDSVIAERSVGAAMPSPIVDSYHCPEGAAPPTTVEFINSPVPGLSPTDRLASGRSRFDRRTDYVLADDNDSNVMFDDYGYLYDISDDAYTDISANSCDSVSFGDFAHTPDTWIQIH